MSARKARHIADIQTRIKTFLNDCCKGSHAWPPANYRRHSSRACAELSLQASPYVSWQRRTGDWAVAVNWRLACVCVLGIFLGIFGPFEPSARARQSALSAPLRSGGPCLGNRVRRLDVAMPGGFPPRAAHYRNRGKGNRACQSPSAPKNCVVVRWAAAVSLAPAPTTVAHCPAIQTRKWSLSSHPVQKAAWKDTLWGARPPLSKAHASNFACGILTCQGGR